MNKEDQKSQEDLQYLTYNIQSCRKEGYKISDKEERRLINSVLAKEISLSEAIFSLPFFEKQKEMEKTEERIEYS